MQCSIRSHQYNCKRINPSTSNSNCHRNSSSSSSSSDDEGEEKDDDNTNSNSNSSSSKNNNNNNNNNNGPLLLNIAKLHTAASFNSRKDECHSATQKLQYFLWKLSVLLCSKQSNTEHYDV